MAYRQGDRYQLNLLPQSIEEYVSPDDPVRVYDSFIEALNPEDLKLEINENQVGNPAYDPKSMLKLLVYGYSYGWRSSRKLERAIHHNLSFIWLMGGLKPDHKTISEFRRQNKQVIKDVLVQCVRLCIKLDMIEGNCLFVDGTKIRGSASINETKTQKGWEKHLKKLKQRIAQLLNECDRIDDQESQSYVKVKKELISKQKRQGKIEEMLKEMQREDMEKCNATDKACINFNSRQGSHAGYNAQAVTDEKHGLIVSTDVQSQSNDKQAFSGQINQANANLSGPCKVAVADAGYANTDNLKEIVDQDIDVIVPSQRQALHNRKSNRFDKSAFNYDADKNVYICPEGHELKYTHYSKTNRQYYYRFKQYIPCFSCRHFGHDCTESKRGRTITRLVNEALKESLEQRYEQPDAQAIYEKRKEKCEPVFGHIKRNLNGGAFLLRGLEAVKAEFSMFGTCYNIARLITIFGGVTPLLGKLKTI